MALCECGCGQETRIYNGRPRRFISGHNRVTLSPEAREKIAASKRGKPRDEMTRNKISQALRGRPSPYRGSKAPWWKEDATYSSIHRWLQRNAVKTGICAECGTYKGTRGRGTGTDWANISGEYKRDLSDYRELCRSCHNRSHRR